MKRITAEAKRIIDAELTDQLLRVDRIRDELVAYANQFIQNFQTDTYLLFGVTPINQLCSLSVKGGLGIANLEAQINPQPPDILVWNNYRGDCDLNLIIKRQNYPQGKPTGEVLAAVGQRTKILLAKTIDETRYSTLPNDLKVTDLHPPLYRCSQIEALAHIIDFISQNLQLPIQIPIPVPGAIVDLRNITSVLKDTIPSLVGICGQKLDNVFRSITGSKSDDYILYDDRIQNLLFVSDLNQVKSSWTDVDYSFLPYAPGRMDTLGYEVSELAIAQQKARQLGKVAQPYDIFKIINSPFVYTTQDTTNAPVPDHDDELFLPVETYNLSLYANNLIDDFVLIRTALRFHGYTIQRQDVQAALPGQATYTVDVRRGAGKCEFVDVAIPRIASPEWFYCQNRTYYINIPVQAPPGAWTFKVCDWDYQVEENLNLLIELGCGLSHSEQKARKRIERLAESWIHGDFMRVFPRTPTMPLPPGVAAPFDAPASLVNNLTQDYLNLFGLQVLPNWLYNEVFLRLLNVKGTTDAFIAAPSDPGKRQVIDSAKALGETGLMEIACMADVVDDPEVTKLRASLKNGDITVNWVLAAYLILKASQIPDVIWFPRYGIMRVINPINVAQDFAVVTDPGVPLAANDCVVVTWDARDAGPPLTFFTIPTGDVFAFGAPNPPHFYDNNLVGAERRLFNEIRNRLARANNQMLRVTYAQMLNCLERVASDSFVDDLLRP